MTTISTHLRPNPGKEQAARGRETDRVEGKERETMIEERDFVRARTPPHMGTHTREPRDTTEREPE